MAQLQLGVLDMNLKHQVIKITHEQLDEPVWDGTYGWIPKGDQADHMLQSIQDHHDIDDRDGFVVDYYTIDSDDMIDIIKNKDPSYTYDY